MRSAAPGWKRSLFGHVAPLALIPALAWPLGHSLDPIGPGTASAGSLAASAGATFVFILVVVVLAAAAVYLLAPVFQTARHWPGAMAVAAYSCTPVLLAAPLLAFATLTILVVIAGLHACFLCRVGVEQLLGCRDEDAAMYVAAAGFLATVAGAVLGGLSSAAGIL